MMRVQAACLFVILQALACATMGADPPDVVLITLDTTRADRLPPHQQQVAAPAFQWLASEGTVFENAVAAVPLTLPSHVSLMTGRRPSHHGVRDNASPALAATELTLAEALRGRGFRTAAFVSSMVLQADRGLAQGFDTYVDLPESPCGETVRRRPANRTADAAIEWFREPKDAPLFAWIHLFDAHQPYEIDGDYARRWTSPYEAAIGFMDQEVGRVLRVLDERGSLHRTVVIVTADHGESFGEHGEEGHGIFLYETTLRVPLIVRGPGIRTRHVADTVRLVDIMPTVLDLVGQSTPATDGTSLRPLLAGGRLDTALDAYSESRYPERFGLSPLQSFRSDRYKLIVAPRPELYDLERDPGERSNRYAERPHVAAALAAQLRFESTEEKSRGPAAPSNADIRSLRALGYVSSSGFRLPENNQLPDPKDFVTTINSLNRPGPALPAGLPRCETTR